MAEVRGTEGGSQQKHLSWRIVHPDGASTGWSEAGKNLAWNTHTSKGSAGGLLSSTTL